MKLKEYVEANEGLWNYIDHLTYTIDEENKCVDITCNKTSTHYRWTEDSSVKLDIIDNIEKTRESQRIRKEITNEE
tara:strand:- start:204 stop:431 length:228 start_codon:yes stop_codon:yes gene_type:complete